MNLQELQAIKDCWEKETNQRCPSCGARPHKEHDIADLLAEIERLTSCLKFEQNYLSRVGTHADGCYKWGPGHWDCAVQEIERLQEENEGLKCCGNCRWWYQEKECTHEQGIMRLDNRLEWCINWKRWEGLK